MWSMAFNNNERGAGSSAFLAQCFWSLFNTLSDISLPANIVTARSDDPQICRGTVATYKSARCSWPASGILPDMTKLPRWYASLAMPSRRIPFAERCRYSSIRLPRLVTRRSSVSFISDSAFPFWQCCTFLVTRTLAFLQPTANGLDFRYGVNLADWWHVDVVRGSDRHLSVEKYSQRRSGAPIRS